MDEVAPTIDERPAAGEDYRLEAQIGFLLRRAHQAASEVFQEKVGALDITPQQFAVLVILNQRGELSQRRLGEATAMDPATLLDVVQRLARRGLLAVRPDPADGRRRLAQLTQSGQSLADTLLEVGPEISAATLAPFSAAERQQLLSLLDRLGRRRP